MSIRWPREAFGVSIIYIRDHVARKVASVVTRGGGVWALLPDGRVGTNDESFFKSSCGKGSQAELRVAENLWRLGKIKKAVYQKLEKAYALKQSRQHKNSVAADLRYHAKELGVPLTREQEAAIAKAIGEAA